MVVLGVWYVEIGYIPGRRSYECNTLKLRLVEKLKVELRLG